MNDDMKTNHDPDQLDALLDQNLAQYSQVSPLAGLEERILARLENAAAQPAPGFMARLMTKAALWVGLDAGQPFAGSRLAGTVTAGLLVVGIGLGMFLVTRPGEDTDFVVEDTIDVKSGGPIETATAPLPARIPQEAFRASTAKLATMFAAKPLVRLAPSPDTGTIEGMEIRQEVFPSPAPLSEQERLALAYARFAHGQEVAVKAPGPGLGELEVAPVAIPEIKIEGLASQAPERSAEQFSKPASIQEGRR